MTNQDGDEIRRHRNIVLIASESGLFIDIVGGMAGECGFEVTAPAPAEPSWLSVTRTQPALVICDCTGPAPNVKRLVVEAVARGLPLLIVATPQERAVAQSWPLPSCVAWLELPIAREPFRTAIADLMSLRRTIMHRTLVLRGPAVRLEAGITARMLDLPPSK